MQNSNKGLSFNSFYWIFIEIPIGSFSNTRLVDSQLKKLTIKINLKIVTVKITETCLLLFDKQEKQVSEIINFLKKAGFTL